MRIIIPTCLIVYLVFYAFEGPVRYGLNILHMDSLIFIRDFVLVAAIGLIFAEQFLRKKIDMAFKIYAGIILVHGTIVIVNIGQPIGAIYGAKLMLGGLAGALCAKYLMNPGPRMLAMFCAFWAVTAIGTFVDKFVVDQMPWIGIEVTLGDQVIELARDWQVSGAAKRAAGLTRASINLAFIEPLLALVLMFHLKRRWMKVAVALITLPVVYWTTQKGAILAFGFLVLMLGVGHRKPLTALKIALIVGLSLAVWLPIFMPGYHMPQQQGQFSLMSFALRVEWMWPRAWHWIETYELFPFGIGLGGIGGAQRFYAPYSWDAADNIYIFFYAYFGLFTFLYLGWILWQVLRLRQGISNSAMQAVATLVYLFSYGIVLSIVEDQMGMMFFTAALAWICAEGWRQRNPDLALDPQAISPNEPRPRYNDGDARAGALA